MQNYLGEIVTHTLHGPHTSYVKLRVCMRRECRERFPRHGGLAIPTCITARAWRTCRDARRDPQLAVYFEVSGGENVPSIPGACATRDSTYLVRGPYQLMPSRFGWVVNPNGCMPFLVVALRLARKASARKLPWMSEEQYHISMMPLLY